MDCSICFEEFDGEDRRPVTGYCGHSLCQKCSRRLEDRSCPSCKREFAFAGEAISFQMLELLDVCKKKEERYTASLNDKEALKANITEMEHDNLGMILALGSEKDKAKDSKKETKQLKKQLAVAMKEANDWQKLAEEAERKAQEALDKLDEMKAQGQVDAPIEQQCEGGAEDGQAPGSGQGGQRSRRKRSANGRYVKNKMMKNVGSKSRRNDELGSRRPTSSQGSTLNRNPVSNSTWASSPKTGEEAEGAGEGHESGAGRQETHHEDPRPGQALLG